MCELKRLCLVQIDTKKHLHQTTHSATHIDFYFSSLDSGILLQNSPDANSE